jgi:zinc transporter
MKLVRFDSLDETLRDDLQGPQWIDLTFDDADPARDKNIDRWLCEKVGLCVETIEILRSRSKRNRRVVVPEGIYLRFCYMTLSPISESADELTEVGILITPERIITARRGHVAELDELWKALNTERAPVDRAWHVLALLVLRIAARIEENLDGVAGQVDELEDRAFEDVSDLPIDDLGQIRRQLIRDRRYITMLARVVEETVADTEMRLAIKSGQELESAANELTRQARTLDFFLERTNLIQDQIESELADRMNRATYRLGVVATVFLPLGFLTGLLGINVAGVPGDHYPGAFWLVCAVLFVIALGAWFFVARMHDS